MSSLSVYTHHLAAGLQTNEADKQRKGYVTVRELHEYVEDKVRKENSHMSPQIFISNKADEIIIAETTQRAQIKIFLAHANEDKTEVLKLYDRLNAKGYKPWMDKKDLIIGQNWREEIPKAISQSDIFIACLSQRSVSKSSFVPKEFRLALNEYAGKPPGEIYLIPLKLDDCEIPDLQETQLGVKMRDIQWLNYWESDSFDKLVEAIEYKTKTFS